MGGSGEKKRQSIPSDRGLLIPGVKREERSAWQVERNEESTMKRTTQEECQAESRWDWVQ